MPYAKMAQQRGLRIYEVPNSYNGRTYDEGKKIGVKDGIRAVYVISKYGRLTRLRREDKQAPSRHPVVSVRFVQGNWPQSNFG